MVQSEGFGRAGLSLFKTTRGSSVFSAVRHCCRRKEPKSLSSSRRLCLRLLRVVRSFSRRCKGEGAVEVLADRPCDLSCGRTTRRCTYTVRVFGSTERAAGRTVGRRVTSRCSAVCRSVLSATGAPGSATLTVVTLERETELLKLSGPSRRAVSVRRCPGAGQLLSVAPRGVKLPRIGESVLTTRVSGLRSISRSSGRHLEVRTKISGLSVAGVLAGIARGRGWRERQGHFQAMPRRVHPSSVPSEDPARLRAPQTQVHGSRQYPI